MGEGPVEPFGLFPNGTSYDRWAAQNCERCVKAGDVSEAGSSACDLFEAIHNNACGDVIPVELAQRLNYCEGPCPEFNKPTPRGVARLEAWNAGRPIDARGLPVYAIGEPKPWELREA